MERLYTMILVLLSLNCGHSQEWVYFGEASRNMIALGCEENDQGFSFYSGVSGDWYYEKINSIIHLDHDGIELHRQQFAKDSMARLIHNLVPSLSGDGYVACALAAREGELKRYVGVIHFDNKFNILNESFEEIIPYANRVRISHNLANDGYVLMVNCPNSSSSVNVERTEFWHVDDSLNIEIRDIYYNPDFLHVIIDICPKLDGSGYTAVSYSTSLELTENLVVEHTTLESREWKVNADHGIIIRYQDSVYLFSVLGQNGKVHEINILDRNLHRIGYIESSASPISGTNLCPAFEPIDIDQEGNVYSAVYSNNDLIHQVSNKIRLMKYSPFLKDTLWMTDFHAVPNETGLRPYGIQCTSDNGLIVYGEMWVVAENVYLPFAIKYGPSEITSVGDFDFRKKEYVVSPNPVTNTFSVQSSQLGIEDLEIRLMNMEGKLVHSTILESNVQVNIQSLKSGTYIYQLWHEERFVQVGTIIKQ